MRKLTHGHSTWTLDIRYACGSLILEYIIIKSESKLMTASVDREFECGVFAHFYYVILSNKYAKIDAWTFKMDIGHSKCMRFFDTRVYNIHK